jgi:taurine--2-oxoglutarate transaminase
MTAKIAGAAMQKGLYMAAWYDTLVIAPPLIITEDQIDEAVDLLDKALKIGDEQAVETDVAASHSAEYK